MDAPTRTIGSYRLLEPLGRGGMGVVYRAVHENGQVVALKTVHVAAEDQVAGLRREIYALSRLRHPGIVRILEEGVSDGLPWCAMELLEGLTLRRHVARLTHATAQTEGSAESEDTQTSTESGMAWWTRTLDRGSAARAPGRVSNERTPDSGREPVSAPEPQSATPVAVPRLTAGNLIELLTLVRRLCASLAYLHGEGLVHRDLKLDNVLVRFDGMPMLVDFGLAAQFAGEVSRDELAAAIFAAGTIFTMAPEQIRGELVDARADLYSLGCVLYELLTAQPPFVGNVPANVLWNHLHAEPEPPSKLSPDVPEALDALVLRLLAKNPRERFGHADDVAAALGRLGAKNGDGAQGVAWPKARAYLYRPTFAGRDEALAALEPHLERLEQGHGTVVLVGGESGMGKTRLLLELARRAERRALRVFSGECVLVDIAAQGAAASGSGVLQPLRKTLQAVADHCREKGPEQTARLLGPRGKVLAQYEPALRTLPGLEHHPDPVELPADAARLRLYSALAETLRALAETEPLLLLLDDLQWADELTLGFLGYMVRTVFSGTSRPAWIMVVGTYRAEEINDALRELVGQTGVRRVRLARLQEAAIGQMVCDMLALGESPTGFVRYLSHQSEGNPFFVAEYLRTAVREGLLWRDEAGDWQVAETSEGTGVAYERLPLPQSLRALVERHLDGLGAEAQSLLEAASVLGREVDGTVLALAAGLASDAMLAGILELFRRQLMEESGRGMLRFVHDKLREVAYDQLDGPRRAKLHQAAAEALESLRPERREEHSAAMGQHWERAGFPQKARTHYLVGARKATSRHAHAEAERLYRAYLGLVNAPTLESIEVRNELGTKILRNQGRAAEAIEQHQQALDEARILGEAAVQVQCLWKLANLRKEIGQMPEAEALFKQALTAAREVGNARDEAVVLNNFGSFRTQQGQFNEARSMFYDSLPLFRKAGHRSGEGIALMNLGVVDAEQGHMAEARSWYEQALVIHEETNDRSEAAHTLSNFAVVCQTEGRLDEVEALCNRALAIQREIGNRRSEGITLGILAIFYRDQGRVEEGWQLLEQTASIHREVDNRAHEAVILRELAATNRLCRAELDEADAFLQKAEPTLYELDIREIPACLCERGHVALARNQSAREFLDRACIVSASLDAGAESAISQAISRLRRANEAFEARQYGRLFRGELVEDVPAGLRQWLVRTGQLAPDEPSHPSV